MCVFGNTKLDPGEDRLTQTLVFPKFSQIYTEKYMKNTKPFKKCYDGKCSPPQHFLRNAKGKGYNW